MRRVVPLLVLLLWAGPAHGQQSIFDLTVTGNIPGQGKFQDGTANAPAMSFAQDTALGSYRIGGSNQGFAASGTLRWDYNATRINLAPGYRLQFNNGPFLAESLGALTLGNASLRLTHGTAANPSRSYSVESSLGSYRLGLSQEAFAAGGVLRWDYNTTRLNLASGYTLQFGSGPTLTDSTNNIVMSLGTGVGTQRLVGIVHVTTTSAATTGTTEETLSSYNLPANALSANGKGLRVTAWGTTAANGNSKTFALTFGATTCSTLSGTLNNAAIVLTALILRAGASDQECGGTGLAGTVASSTRGTPAEAETGAIVIAAKATTPTASGDLSFQAMTVEVLN